MPIFTYHAYDPRTQKETDGSVDSADEPQALTALRRQGLRPIDIRELPAGKPVPRRHDPSAGGWLGRTWTRISARRAKPWEVTLLARQLATLQDAGLPLSRSLHILVRMQHAGQLKSALESVRDEIQNGTMLSEAMARHPHIWDRLTTNLVRAGETAGALEVILRRLAEFREKAAKLRKQVVGALIYPSAVMTIAVAILTFIMVVIVPRFEVIFKELGITLPYVTVLLIDTSRMMASRQGLEVFGGLMAMAVLVVLLRRHTAWGEHLTDRIVLRLPVLGKVLRLSSVARFSRTLGTLVSSGVGFLEALEVVRLATPNVVVRDAIAQVREAVKEGETIHGTLARSGVFDEMVVNLVQVGEETGELDQMLVKIADTYDEQVDSAVAAMLALLEPALLVFMGGAVGFIVIALFMPLIEILMKGLPGV